MKTHRVVVTGLGAITPLGLNVNEYWDGLVNGRSGIGMISTFDTSRQSVKIAAEVKNYNPEAHFEKKEARKLDKFVQLSVVAAKEAVSDAGLDLSKEDTNEIGVEIGVGIGGIGIIEEQHTILMEKGPSRVSPFLIPKMIPNMASGQVSISLGLKGPNLCICTACATSTHAVGDAFRIVERGDAVIMLAGGSESAISPLGLSGFSNMQALSTRNDAPEKASRPFDAQRDGFVMGEGSAVLVLEQLEHAQARGAKIYCEIIGYGLTGDAYHMTAPAPEGEGGARAMAMAIRNAGHKPEDVDYINAHGTSTPLNDKLETMAIKKVFGEHAKKLAISSNKSMIGHLLGAAGAAEAIATCLTIKNSIIPPTINYEFPDPECDLDYVPNQARQREVNVAISNSLGFGGHNTTIVLRKFL